MDSFETLNIKRNFTYKGSLKYNWRLSKDRLRELPETIIEEIFGGIEGNFKSHQLERLKQPLTKLFDKKISIDRKLDDLVKKADKKEESGSSVGLLVWPLVQNLIPLDLIGGHQNRLHFLKELRKALKSGINDAIPLSPFIKGLKKEKVIWLQGVQSDYLQSKILANLVKWLWEVVKSLIASKYYVTEGQGSSKLLFIPKKVWQSRTDKAFNSMVNCVTLVPLAEETAKALEAKRKTAYMRWLPKNSGALRPIIYLRKNATERVFSNNSDLKLKAFVQYLLEMDGNCSSLKPNLLHKNWKQIVEKIGGGSRQKIHMVTVDVKDAYGSVVQDKLLDIVLLKTRLFFGSENQDCVVTFSSTNKKNKKSITCLGNQNHSVRNTTLSMKLNDLLEGIKNIVTCQTIKRMKKSYLLKKGISQAMPVSPALCDLYLSHFTQTHLAQFTAHREDSLLRAMDDFLYLTPSQERAQLFLYKMSVGFPDYNLKIQEEKTQSTLKGNNKVDFFGHTFHQNFEVYARYNDGANLPFRHTMAFSHRMTPVKTLEDKMQRVPTYKLKKLTLDAAYMSVKGVYWNVFHTACYMACCFKVIVNTVGSDRFDVDALLQCVDRASSSISSRAHKIRGSEDILKRELRWVVVRAFFLCMEKHSTSLVRRLEQMENEARSKVRLRLIEEISSFVNFLPAQFRTGY